MDIKSVDGKIQIANGDFVIASKTEHDFELTKRIIRNGKGNFLRAPTLGVGMDKNVNGPLLPEVIRDDITSNLEADKFKVYGFSFVENNDGTYEIVVNAERKQKRE